MAAAPRRKAPRLLAPQTIEEATALLGRYIDGLTEIESLRADADVHIAAIQSARDQVVKPIEEALKDMFRQLRAWWAVAAPAITDGKRKSVEIAGALIGERRAPPKLSLGNKKPEDVIDALLYAQMFDFVRVKDSLDKPALLKALADATSDLAVALRHLGLDRVQADEFFIDRAAREPADPETVPTGEDA